MKKQSGQSAEIMVYVMDHDRKVFSVHGPMFDDTPFQDKVIAACKNGRDVNCASVRNKTQDEIIADYKRDYGYEHVAHAV